MRVVVDEGVPKQLVAALRERGIEADRFPRKWESLENGDLIAAVEGDGFAVLVTNDKNMAFQKSLKGRDIAVVALPHNKRRLIVERVDDIEDTIRRAQPGRHVVMSLDGTRASRWLVEGETLVEEMPAVAPFRLR